MRHPASRLLLQIAVSIHARPCGRAMPRRQPVGAGLAIVSIRARPCGRAMRIHRGVAVIVSNVSIRARPCGRAMPAELDELADITEVSIRARPCGRAMREQHAHDPRSAAVSIRARPCGRAMRQRAAGAGCCRVFQSAPDLAAGRCSTRRRTSSSSPSSFNPRPTLRPGDAQSGTAVSPPL